MTKMSKRVLVSVLTLVLTVVALGTTTFAWFSLSNISSVSGITGDVIAGEGLEVAISKKDKTSNFEFLNNLTDVEFQKLITDIGSFKNFDAVTTVDGKEFTKLAFDINNKITVEQPTTSNVEYLEFQLTFRSKAKGSVSLKDYSFGGTTTTFKPDGIPYIQNQGSTTEGNDPVLTSAASGARIAFVKGETVTGYQAPASIVIGSNTVTNMISGTNPIAAGQWSYLTVGKRVDIYKNATEKLEISDFENINLMKAETVVSPTALLELKSDNDGYFQNSIIVKLWIEGWDSDTYDSIFGLTLDVNLEFELTVAP